MPMRALIVTNMYATAAAPALGSFVRDQVEALRRLPGVEIELFSFAGGDARAYLRAAAQLRHRYRSDRFELVHAHFGLTAWPAMSVRAGARAVTLHGTDLADPRSRVITLAALPLVDLAAVVSDSLANEVPRWAHRSKLAVLPCGVDMSRFRPISRPEARARLGLDPDGPYLLFPSDPGRPEKRYDRAQALSREVGDVRLLTLGNVDPREVPLWVNAANAVLVPSEREGFGLAVLEALACDVPVLATPAGIAPKVLQGLGGTLCGPFDLGTWGAVIAPHLGTPDPRLAGRARAEEFSSDRMAIRVLAAWRALQ